jgi:thymidylate kinase
MLKEITNIFNQGGFDWAFAREPEVIHVDLRKGDDIDVWCESAGLFPVIHLLLMNGWYLIGGRQLGQQGRASTNTQLRFKKRLRSGPVLDVAVGSLRWWLVVYLEESKVIDNVSNHNNVPFLSGAALLSILITRVALRGELTGERLVRARRAYASSNERERETWFRHCAHLFGNQRASVIRGQIQSTGGSCSAPSRAGIICRALLSSSSDSVEILKSVCRVGMSRATKYFRRKQGGVFCIIGTDGTGKTTLAMEIRAALQKERIRTIYHYMGRAKKNTALIEGIRRVALHMVGSRSKRRLPNSSTVPEADRGHKSLALEVLHNIGAVIYWIEYWWRHVLFLRLGCLRGTSFVLDRGSFDLLVMPHLCNPIRRLIGHIPIPDVLIMCDAQAEEIYRRKQERRLNEIRQQQKTYRKAYQGLKGQIPVLHLTTIEPLRKSNSQISIGLVLSAVHVKRGLIDKGILRGFNPESTHRIELNN